MAKQVKDLCIGNDLYFAEMNNIKTRNVTSLIKIDSTTIKVTLGYGNKCSGNNDNHFLISEEGNIYFTDYKIALEKQTELRKNHFETLLANIEKANKELSEFVKEYSILK
jgi:hypothetical protein